MGAHTGSSRLLRSYAKPMVGVCEAPMPADAEARLAAKLKSGGSGAWGDVAMPGQPQVNAVDTRTIIQWILGGAR
jgi:hypothetical protein